jgi:CheY-like chemotaxis protein
MATAECILVVDDDKEIREILVELLEEHGCPARGAENGRAALKVLETMHGDRACLILLDLMMPVMDGQMFRHEQMKRQELAGIPVVVISAHQERMDEMTAMNVEGFLRKPLQLDDVLRTAKQFCACDA